MPSYSSRSGTTFLTVPMFTGHVITTIFTVFNTLAMYVFIRRMWSSPPRLILHGYFAFQLFCRTYIMPLNVATATHRCSPFVCPPCDTAPQPCPSGLAISALASDSLRVPDPAKYTHSAL